MSEYLLESDVPGKVFKDCEHCTHTFGTLGCCTTDNNKWVWACVNGHELFEARKIRVRLTREEAIYFLGRMRSETNDVAELGALDVAIEALQERKDADRLSEDFLNECIEFLKKAVAKCDEAEANR